MATKKVTPRANAVKISVINSSTVLTDTQIAPVVRALQIQVTRDFANVYGIDAILTQVPKGQTPDVTSWWLVFLDTSDQAGALGYHDLTSTGLPLAKVFAKTDIDNNESWSVTASHELLEMLADPWINLCVFVQTSNTVGKLYSYEVCDTCESFNYDINGIKVSDFAFPAWWGVPGSPNKFDFLGQVKQVLEILPGGYIGEFDVMKGGGWKQLTHSEASTVKTHKLEPKMGSRRERRVRGAHNWKLSTCH